MSEEEKKSLENEGASDHMEVTLGYNDTSKVFSKDGKENLSFSANIHRGKVHFRGRIKETVVTREVLSALYDVVSSDYRYVPKDRTAYLAYQRLKKQSSQMDALQAQQAYFDWLERNDPLAFIILDPIITAHPDEVSFEVFSKDEGTYARASFDWSAFELEGKASYGTTNIDFSKSLFQGIQRMRSYRESWLEVGSEAVKLENKDAKEIVEKKIKVPWSWVRGFLQVQSAATLPSTSVELAPIDLYNILRQLRLRADKKKGGRAIRIELVPGEYPRLVLEPWEKVLVTKPEIYKGKKAQVIRIWGRRRLMLLRRVLPFVRSVKLHLLGSGLPSFMVLEGEFMKFTLGITGFTATDWSRAASFDLLLPRQMEEDKDSKKVYTFLSKKYSGTIDEIVKGTKMKKDKLLRVLQTGCQQGKLMFDLEKYRLRPITDEDISLEQIEYRNNRERFAYDLLAKKQVTLETQNFIFGKGIEITGKVEVKEEKREYTPSITISEDNALRKAECSCSFYRKNRLTQGPCSHLIALRLLYELEEQKRKAGKGKNIVTLETRVYSKRSISGENIVQLTLNRKRLKKRWGMQGEELRLQNLVFNSVDEARDAFYMQADSLESKGFLDITR